MKTIVLAIALAALVPSAFAADNTSTRRYGTSEALSVQDARLGEVLMVRPGPSRPIPEELRGVLPSLCGPERIQGLIDEGHSLGEIARHLGLSRQGLSAYCRRKKLKTRPVFKGRRSRAKATACGSPESSYA